MATRSFTEYIVSGKTYYKRLGEAKKAAREAQRIADETGRPYEMKVLSGWIDEDPSGFVYDSEVTGEKVRVFKPKRRNPRRSVRTTKKRMKKLLLKHWPKLSKAQQRREMGEVRRIIRAGGFGRTNPVRGRKVKGGRSVTVKNFTGTIVSRPGRIDILGRGRRG